LASVRQENAAASDRIPANPSGTPAARAF
jgi:hypothetical protein